MFWCKQSILSVSFFYLVVIGCSNQNNAGPQNTSSGANPNNSSAGTAKPRIFVMTPETTQGNIGTAAAADALCMASAAKPATGTYKALLVNASRRACSTANCTSAAENLDWVFAANKTYYQSDATTVVGTTNAGGIFAYPISAGFTTMAHGVFTGLNANWTTGQNCNNWTSASAAANGVLGSSDSTTSSNIAWLNVACDSGMHLACVEQ